MLPILGAIIGPVIKTLGALGKSWLDTRKVKAEGAVKIAAAKIEAKIAKQQAVLNMDLTAMSGMRWSWKDEYLLIVLSAPIIMAFIPGMEMYITKGFEVIQGMPDWYQWAMTGMIAATFGLRSWLGFKK